MLESVRNRVTVQRKYPNTLIVDVSHSSFVNGYWSKYLIRFILMVIFVSLIQVDIQVLAFLLYGIV